MMVLHQAVLLTQNNKHKTAIRFAALCHDLGKGLTTSEYLPSHPGHEKAGLPLVEKKYQNSLKYQYIINSWP